MSSQQESALDRWIKQEGKVHGSTIILIVLTCTLVNTQKREGSGWRKLFQGRICIDSGTCCHTEEEIANEVGERKILCTRI